MLWKKKQKYQELYDISNKEKNVEINRFPYPGGTL